MTLTELQQEVITLTNRPDLAAETLLAVRQSTLALHQMDYWWKDVKETGISFSTPEYLQEIEYRPIIPRFRALKYVRKSDVTGAGLEMITVVQPESVLDAYGTNRVDVAYAAGQSIEIRSSTLLQYCILGYYEHPNITPTGYSSWIAEDHPYAIVFEAAEKVFKMIGKSEEFAAYKLLRDEEKQRLTISNVQAMGY
jgi:hypothetical protein